MKKLTAISAFCIMLLGTHVQAQITEYAFAGNSNSRPKTSVGAAISSRAVNDFSKMYGSAADVQWSQLKDKGFMCIFQLKGVDCRAYFNPNGTWHFTVAGYLEDHLPGNIRETVHRNYYGYLISYAQEITMAMDKTVYMVQLTRGNTLKILRVTSEDLEELEEWTN
jgi:hypothetical protein